MVHNSPSIIRINRFTVVELNSAIPLVLQEQSLCGNHTLHYMFAPLRGVERQIRIVKSLRRAVSTYAVFIRCLVVSESGRVGPSLFDLVGWNGATGGSLGSVVLRNAHGLDSRLGWSAGGHVGVDVVRWRWRH